MSNPDRRRGRTCSDARLNMDDGGLERSLRNRRFAVSGPPPVSARPDSPRRFHLPGTPSDFFSNSIVASVTRSRTISAMTAYVTDGYNPKASRC